MSTLRRIVRGARVTLTVAAIAGYAVVSHLVSTSPPPAGFGTVLFAVAPLCFALLAVMWRSHRWPAIALAAAGISLLWWRSDLLASHLPHVYLLQSLSTSAALMLLFGASLRAGAEPLCARLAATLRGQPLAPDVARYTRQVTVAWTVFFAAMIVLSLALFALAPVAVWSLVANVLFMPMICAMFFVEYLVRRRVLRDEPHVSLSTTVDLWRMHTAGSNVPLPPVGALGAVGAVGHEGKAGHVGHVGHVGHMSQASRKESKI